MPKPTHYEILGVTNSAPDHVIKSAFRAHAKHSHPDASSDSDTDFAAINKAYSILSSPTRRADYDRELGSNTKDSGGQTSGPDINTDSYEDTWGSEASWTPEYEYQPADFAAEDPRKLAGFDAWKSLPLAYEQIEWLPEARRAQMNYVPLDQLSPPMQQTSDAGGRERTGKHGVKCLVWSIIWFVVAIVYSNIAAGVNAGLFGMGAFVGAAIFGLPYVFGGRTIFVKWLTLGYYVFAVVALLIGMVLASSPGSISGNSDSSPVPSIIALASVTVALGVSFWFATREGNQAFANRDRQTSRPPQPVSYSSSYDGPLISPERAERIKQWGTPGRGLNDPRATPFTERNAELGFGGEILTSQLMDPMAEIPGVRIVHGINLPGHGDADIDHAILCGDLLVAVDSKHWPGGNYYWLSEQVMCSTQKGNERRGNPMSWGLPTLQQNFPNKRLFPVVVIHSHDGGVVATNNRNRGINPVLMTPVQFVEEVGRMCVNQHATTVDPVALSKLVSMMIK